MRSLTAHEIRNSWTWRVTVFCWRV